MKKWFFSVVFIVTTVFLLGWSSCLNFQPANHKGAGDWQLLVAGNEVTNSEIVDLIAEKSTVYQQGYIVIVDLGNLKNEKPDNRVKQLFYEHEINAVHILKINPASQLKPSDVLTIENAAVVLLLPINRKMQPSLLNNNGLIKALKTAFQKGAFMAAKGNEFSKLVGTIYYHQYKDSVKGIIMVRQQKGLGFIHNVVVDLLPFYNHFKKGIVKDVKSDKFVFVALGKKSMVLIGKEQAMVSGGDKVGVLMPGKPFRFYKNGEQFSLQP